MDAWWPGTSSINLQASKTCLDMHVGKAPNGTVFLLTDFQLSTLPATYSLPPEVLCLSEKHWFLTWNNLIVFYWPVRLCLRGHSLCLQFQDNLAQHVSLAANSSYKQAKKEAVCMPFNRLA